MKRLDLTGASHEVFEFIEPTEHRLHKSVAWRARCKKCGREQLVGASQINSRAHTRCVYCMIPKEINARTLND